MREKKHIAAFDGLRGIAIIAVILYHFRPTLLQGGFIGVSIFFVLAGYLMRQSIDRIGFDKISKIGVFFKRRILRLWPLMLLCIAFSAIGAYIFSPSLLVKVQSDTFASSFFFVNILYIIRKLDYFAAAGLPSPLTHLWYVGVLLQLNIAWAMILYVYKRYRRKAVDELQLSAVCIIISVLYMALCFKTGRAASAYYSPIARFAEFGIGSSTFIGYKLWRTRLSKYYHSNKRAPLDFYVIRYSGIAAAVILLISTVLAHGDAPYMYYGGYFFYSVCAALVCVTCIMPRSLTAKIFSFKPLCQLGTMTYSFYLVHYPILLFMNPANRTENPSIYDVVLQFLAIICAGLLCYYFIERPLHKLQLSYIWLIPGISALCCIALIIAPVNWSELAQARAQYLRPELSHVSAKRSAGVMNGKADQKNADHKAQKDKKEVTSSAPHGPIAEKVPANLPWKQWKTNIAAHTSSARVLIIGDSITLGASPALQATFANALIDAKVSRQLWDAPDLITQHKAEFHPEAVVVALGTNCPITEDNLQSVLNAVGGLPVYFLTIRVALYWQDPNNALLREFAAKHSNVGLIDWNGVTAGHGEYLSDDGVHPTPDGVQVMSNLYFDAFRGADV
ncbi:MAG: acyltransferase family protein [Bifidobacteriaceae bacterium]|nr:acyltransferase family protein [Bifidobacteriaceae bacterium]